ncbi:MAG TPA: holo-ACP synthase [Planctomycetota bacterium]
MTDPATAETPPGLGLDLVDLDRFQQAMERSGEAFLARIFTGQERAECAQRSNPLQHFAARFAAKEAGMKALGTGWTGGVGFHDFEVISDGANPPRLYLYGKAAEVMAAHGLRGTRLSMSHTERTAGAVVQLLSTD